MLKAGEIGLEGSPGGMQRTVSLESSGFTLGETGGIP